MILEPTDRQKTASSGATASPERAPACAGEATQWGNRKVRARLKFRIGMTCRASNNKNAPKVHQIAFAFGITDWKAALELPPFSARSKLHQI